MENQNREKTEKESIVKQSLKLFASDQISDRLQAIRSLCALGPLTSTVKLFSYKLQDPEAAVRQELVFAMGKVGGKEVIPLLSPLLSDPAPEVRLQVIETVAEMSKDDAAAVLLIQSLKDPLAAIRAKAAELLQFYRKDLALSALNEATYDENTAVRSIVLRSIHRLSPSSSISNESEASEMDSILNHGNEHSITDADIDSFEPFSTENLIMDELHLGDYPESFSEVNVVLSGVKDQEERLLKEMLGSIDRLEQSFIDANLLESQGQDIPLPNNHARALSSEEIFILEEEHTTGVRISPDFTDSSASEVTEIESAPEEVLILDESYTQDEKMLDLNSKNQPETLNDGEILVLDEAYCLSVAQEAKESSEKENVTEGRSGEGRSSSPYPSRSFFSDYPEWTPGGTAGGVRMSDLSKPSKHETVQVFQTSLEEALQRLHSSDHKERILAIQALIPVIEEPLPLFNILRDDTNPGVRALCATALGSISWKQEEHKEKIVEMLTKALRDPAAPVREASVRALGKFSDPCTLESLIRMFADDNRSVRQGAAEALGSLKSSQALPALYEQLNDPDHFVRESVLIAIAEIGNPLARMHVEKCFSADPNVVVRVAAAYALAQLQHPEGFPSLLAFLKDRNMIARMKAAFYLGYLEDPAALPALQESQTDASALVRQAVEDAMERICGAP